MNCTVSRAPRRPTRRLPRSPRTIAGPRGRLREHRRQPGIRVLGRAGTPAREAVLTKLSASAFTSSGIDALLRNLGVRSLIITGVSTSHCVDLTARDAADRGYETLVVEDAVAEDLPDHHAWSLAQFQRFWGRVETTQAVMAELAGYLQIADAPTRR